MIKMPKKYKDCVKSLIDCVTNFYMLVLIDSISNEDKSLNDLLDLLQNIVNDIAKIN